MDNKRFGCYINAEINCYGKYISDPNTIIFNFEGKYIQELETKWETAPQFIQVEAHPYFTQKELRVTLDKYGIKLMSWYRRKPSACLPSFRCA